MLRGLALGVIGLTLVEMVVSRFIAPPSSLSEWLLISAFGASALFAVAAAVTLFSVEREIGTTVFLELLPQNRVALFTGKVLAAVLMTLVVLAVLSASIYVTGHWPDAATAQVIAAQGSVAIVEALAYGLLMSLVCPQPLLAALLAIAAASLSSQLAMAVSAVSAQGFTLKAYQQATSARLMLAALIGVLDVSLGLRWLKPLSLPRRIRSRATDATASEYDLGLRLFRWGMLGKLLWQSVRQSWKAIVAATAIGLVLMFATDLIRMTLIGARQPLSLLFLPALYGALTFRADQRRLQYRFLAEHAGRPRMIWLSRQLTWLAPTITWCLVVHVGVWLVGHRLLLHRLGLLQSDNFVLGRSGDGQWNAALQMTVVHGYYQTLYVTALFWLASLTAYALGQFLSLVFRSDIFAGLLSLGGSMILLLWVYLMMAWQLPAVWFIAPVAVGLFLASWLRVPAWLIERRGLTPWIKPVLAAMVPAIVVLCFVPIERAAQVRGQYFAPSLDIMHRRLSHSRLFAQARSRSADSPEPDVLFDGWEEQVQALYLPRTLPQISVDILAEATKHSQIRGSALADDYAVLAEELDTPGFLPNEEFDQRVLQLTLQDGRLTEQVARTGQPNWRRLLLYALSRSKQLKPTDLSGSLDMLLAARRIGAQHLRGEDLSAAWDVRANLPATDSAQALVDWATDPNQAPELLKRAIDELSEINRNWPNPSAAVMNNYLAARAVVRGDTAPSFLTDKQRDRLENWLPYLANQLPGEASRAERALDILAACALDYFAGLDVELANIDGTTNESSAQRFRARLQPWYLDDPTSFVVSDGLETGPHVWERAKLVRAAQTSYLAAEEFIRFNELPSYAYHWIADLAQRRAELVRLALIAYRLDHGQYPEALDELVPEYLTEREISDPYAAGPFEYRREGFDHWILNEYFYQERAWYPPHTPVLWSIGPSEAKPREEVVEYILSESGARVPTERQPQEDLDRLSPDEFHTETVTKLEPTTRQGGWGHFWLPLPVDLPAAEAD